jgi:Family of unknown function (DUF6174)
MATMTLLVTALALSACDSTGDVPVPEAACTAGYKKPDLAAIGQQLTEARALWKTAAIENYSYEYSYKGEYGPSVKVTVKAGQVTLTELLDPKSGGLSAGESKTVDTRFGDIAALIDLTSKASGECKVLSLTFDAGDGHPLKTVFGNAEKNIQDGLTERSLSNMVRL